MEITNEQMMALMQDEKVIDVLQSKSHIDLAKLIGRELCGFTHEDEKYIDIFWEVAFNKSWIYVSEDMVCNEFGYKQNSAMTMMPSFYKKLKAEFDEGVDYKIVDKTHDLVKHFYLEMFLGKDGRGGALKKHYIITGETYKILLQSAHTKHGKIVRRYFIKTETLCQVTNRFISLYMDFQLNSQANQLTQKDNQLTEKNSQITKLESRQMKLESFIQQVESLNKEQILYLATTDSYGPNNRFEYGGVQHEKDLKQRLASYNTGRAEGDLYKFVKIVRCNNYRLIEDRLHNILIQFKDKQGSRKEMVHLRYDWLERVVDFVCENYDREIDFVNEYCQQFLHDTIDLEAIMPPTIDINDYLTVTLHRGGRVVRQEKIDVTGWEEKKIDDMFKDAINHCAAEYTNTPYDFSTHKNTTLMNLEWGMLTSYFDGYVGTKKWWRDRVKEWLSREKPTHLRIKGLKMP